jgi:hypothetical protein
MNSYSHKSLKLTSKWSLRFIAQPTLGANEGDTMKGVA